LTPWASVRYTGQQDGPEVTYVRGMPIAGTTADDGTTVPTFETMRVGGSRFYGTAGVKAHTDIQRIYNAVASKLWDLHRMRHVVSPEFTAFSAWSNKEYDELFGFDDDVDRNLDAFGAVDMRVRQRWQTLRGGPGRWTSVDWFTLTTGATLYRRDDLDPQFLRGRFFDAAPEYSQARDNLYLESAWRVSETTSILADCQYDLDTSDLSFANIGVAVSKTPRLTHYLGARYIRALNSTVITYSTDYRLNYKYRLRLLLQYDTEEQKFIESHVRVTRRMPGWIVEVGVGYDQLDDDLSAQFALYPVGAEGARIGSFQ
jgi:hypothetical protein